MRAAVALVAAVLLLGACTDAEPPRAQPSTPPAATPPPTPTPPAEPAPEPEPEPDPLRIGTAVAAVEVLAGEIGPRPGESPAYRRAVRHVERELTGHGWTTTRQGFDVPAGVSWGEPVPGGRSSNVVASRGDLVPGKPWLLVGAHLDTVPQAPGAEDNASGVGVLLALAETLEGRATRLPVVLVAFGAEEPRGPSDDEHHYGSRAYVAALDEQQRESLRGMVSLDRVGVGDVLPLGSVEADDPLRGQLERAARRAGVEVAVESGQRSSDHWSFVRDGLPGVRLGSTPYAGYHSPGDTPEVVDRAQLARAARTVLAWLS